MRTKVDHTNTKCCICGNSKSNLKCIFEEKEIYLWHREYDENGNWTNRYRCTNCNNRVTKPWTTLKDIGMKRNVYYNKTNIYDRCNIEKLIPGQAYKEYDNKKCWTGKWLCLKCHHIEYNKEYDKRPDSRNNILKSLTDHRTNNLDPYCSSAKGDLFQKLTCKWRGLKDLNIENDNYNFPMDHSIDTELGMVQTKGAFIGISGYNEGWAFCTRNEQGKNFDYLITYCVNNNIIEKIFIIPNIEIVSRTGFWISKNYLKGWYEKYRIKDTETIKNINDIFQRILKRVE